VRDDDLTVGSFPPWCRRWGGTTLQPNPLVVFSVTIAAGTLFGMVGLILAAQTAEAASPP
jgi:hypothetical protein